MANAAGVSMTPTDPEARRSLLRGLTLTVVAVWVAALLFGLLYLLNRTVLPAALGWVIVVGLGLVAGFVARWSLPARAALLRWLAALAVFILGGALLSWISTGLLGISPWAKVRTGINWLGLAQLVVGGGAAWLAVHAWLGGGAATEAAPASGSSRRLRLPLRVRGGRAGASMGSQPRIKPGLPRSQPRRTVSRRRRARVHLTGVVEQRCPYCLEPVLPGDPRGEWVCPICHTAHHADCWRVTGACQVPHFNG
jgi:hypothetical protein